MEDNSIFAEINEELKNDQLMAFFKKHQNAIMITIAIIVVGIIAHSSWYARQNKQKEEISIALLTALQNPGKNNDVMLQKLMDNAPSELKPILYLIRSGKNLTVGDDIQKTADELLQFINKKGVDVVWRDLAIIILASQSIESAAETIDRLTPLTEKGRPFRFSAMEFIAVLQASNGNYEESFKMFDQILDAKDAPNTLKERLRMLRNNIKNSMSE